MKWIFFGECIDFIRKRESSEEPINEIRFDRIFDKNGNPLIFKREKWGKWIDRQEKEQGFFKYRYECSNCKMRSDWEGRFCPYCGARMEKERK